MEQKKSIYNLLVLPDDKLMVLLERASFRSSGPGGQKVNKTSSAVRLEYAPLGLSVACQKYRKSEENRRSALRLLREEMAYQNVELPPKEMADRLGVYFKNGLHINPKNQDIPLIFAVLCAFFLEEQGDHKGVALKLGLTPSRLNKFIHENKRLLERVNRIRTEAGKPELKL